MTKKMTKKRKVLFYTIMILIIIVSIELLLQVFSALYYSVKSDSVEIFENNANELRILCLGESTTYGSGAINGYDYPALLQNVLNSDKTKSDKTIKVFNVGLPGTSSSEIIRHFTYQVKKFKPHIIITLFGSNDFGQYLDGVNSLLPVNSSFIISFQKVLFKIKIYQFIKLMLDYFSGQFFVSENREGEFYLNPVGLAAKMPDSKVRYELIVPQLEFNYSLLRSIYPKGKYLLTNYLFEEKCKNANSAIRLIAQKLNYYFCEQTEEKSSKYNISLTSQDGWHPNSKGYEIMANNLYNCLMQKRDYFGL